MRRIYIICLLALSATALLVTAPAASAAKAKKKPVITRVTPMRISVGNVLTIRGRNFKASRKKNTVIFRSPSGRSAFAKPRRASRTKLVVVVPAAVARLLDVEGGSQRPTRLKLRVLAGTFSRYTKRRLSPVVTAIGDGDGRPGGGGGGPAKICNDGGPGGDHDGDLLANASEGGLGTDPCLADTDTDGVEDGYEYQSALDLNHYPRTPPLPYPGKRPYPNALDPGDGQFGGTDYDGDGLDLRDEFLLWMGFTSDGVRRAGHPTTLSGLLYSDGLQKSIDPAPPAPADPLYNWALDWDEDNELSDDERDADADGLGNWDELRGRMIEDWWPAQHDGQAEPKESRYPDIDFLDNEDTAPAFNAHVDSDMDGDGVLDGADDNDHDGLSNQFEVRRPDDWDTQSWTEVDTDGDGEPDTFVFGGNAWAYTNPFNPCKPFNSERCHRYVPFGYYSSDQRPPVGPDPPAGYPGTHPATPNG
jgi:IPT/TIG domain